MRALLIPSAALRHICWTAVALTLTAGGWVAGLTQVGPLHTQERDAGAPAVPAAVVARAVRTLAPAPPANASPTTGLRARPMSMSGGAPSRAERLAEADRLHRRAVASGQALRLREAAAWHLRAAALRTEEDSLTYRCREQAAAFLYAAGDLAGARATFARAAAHAQAHGHAADAADAFIKAGLVAKEQGDPAGESLFARRAAALLASPTLTSTQRERLSARIVSRGRPIPADSDTAGTTAAVSPSAGRETSEPARCRSGCGASRR